MPSFQSQRHTARRTSQAIARACEMSVKAGSLQPLGLIAGGSQQSFREGQSRQQLTNSADQIRHFRGQSYTSIRPIATRVAGQPFRLAKIVKGVRGKQNRSIESRVFWRAGIEDFLEQKMGLRLKSNEDIEIVDQHQILDRLEHPWDDNPGFFGWHLKYETIASLKMTGTWTWWMPVTKGKRQVLYLPPNWIRPVASDKALFDHFAVKLQGSSEEEKVPAKEIAYSFYPDPSDPTSGYGPFEASYAAIVVSEFIQEARKRGFQLGIHPPMIFRISSGLTKDGKPVMRRLAQWQINQTKEAIMSRHRGMTNYGDPLFLDGTVQGPEVCARKMSEMDFGANAASVNAEVEQAYGTPPYIAGASSLGSRAESGEADGHFVRNTVNPDIALVSQGLTLMVLPKFDNSGQYILFIEPANPDDTEMAFKAWQLAVQNGCATVNMFLTHVLRQPPVPWGDAVWTPKGASLIPVSLLTKGYVAPIGAGSLPTAPEQDLPPGQHVPPDPDAPNPDEEDAAIAEGDEPPDGEEVGKGRNPFAKAVHDAAFYRSFSETWLKVHGARETAMADDLMKLFRHQAGEVVEAFKREFSGSDDLSKKTTGEAMARAVFKPADWTEAIKDAALKSLGKTMAAGALHEWKSFGQATKAGLDIGLSFDFGVPLPDDILDGLRDELTATMGEDYWGGIAETQLDDLARALGDALDAGKHPDELVSTVRDVFDGEMGRDRAARIARTESTGAMGAGQQAARQKLHADGIVEGKEWASTHDMLTREAHYETNGQERAVSDDFSVAGYPAAYPGDRRLPASLRCNCRCAALSVTVHSNRGLIVTLKLFAACDGCAGVKGAWPYRQAA